MTECQPRKQVRVQTLEENNFHDGQLFQLKQGCVLRLKPSNQLVHKRLLRVFCNMPPVGSKAAAFERATFYEYKWRSESGLVNDDFGRYVDIVCKQAGSFHYYFTHGELEDERKRGGCTFMVDPELRTPDGSSIDLNSLQIHTVISKLLGPLDQWLSRLECSKAAGYNMIHFTPIQELSQEVRLCFFL